MYYINEITSIVACPIKGQIRKECASHPGCHQTCNSTNTTVCPAVCIINGCECPNGTVIDENRNECVTPSECAGIQTILIVMTPMMGSRHDYCWSSFM